MEQVQNSETRTYIVEGMTCEHCRASVIEEVSEVPGAEAVEVDLATGRLEVRGDVSDEAVAEAVEEAGYRLAGQR
jgi:copper chaperone CopZ